MEVKEIISRKNGEQMSQEEMSFVIQEYIKEKKGKVVYLNLMKGLDQRSPLFEIMFTRQWGLMQRAFGRAQQYFSNKS